jgi:hypothetical protein
MSRNRHNLVPQDLPKGISRIGLHENTLGKRVVEHQEAAVHQELTAGQWEEAAEKAAMIYASKKMPERTTKIGRKVGQLIGRVMTPEEAELIDWSIQNSASVDHLKINAERYYGKAKEELGSVRAILRGLDTQQQGFAGQMHELIVFDRICNTSAPNFLKVAKEKSEQKDITWRQWLASEATDDQLVNFLQWHNYQMDKRQKDPELQSAIVSHRQNYKQEIKRGVEEGRYHPDALSAVPAVDGVEIKVGDVFDLALQHRAGYHIRGSGYITIRSPGATIYHELNHKFGEFGPHWRDEAATSHIEQTIAHGQPNTIRPEERSDDNGSYREQRALLADVLRNVPASLLTRAYFARGEAKQEAEAKLEHAIDRAWSQVLPEGVSVLPKIDSYIQKLVTRYVNNDGLLLDDAQLKAAAQTREDLRNNPEDIFGRKKRQQKVNHRPDISPELAARLLRTRAKKGTDSQNVHVGASETSFDEGVARDVSTKISSLRAKGESNTAVYRQLSKELHPDAAGEGSKEKMQYLNEWRKKEAA